MDEQKQEGVSPSPPEAPPADQGEAYLTAWINIRGTMTPIKMPKPDGRQGPGAYETAPF